MPASGARLPPARNHLAGVPITSTPGGGVKLTSSGLTLRVALRLLEHHGRGLPELVLDDHALQGAARAEAQQRAAEIRLAALRLHQHPFQPVALAGLGQLEVLAHVTGAGQQHRGRRRKRRIRRLHRHLLELAIVEPDVASVGHQQLRRRRFAAAAQSPSGISRAAARAACRAARSTLLAVRSPTSVCVNEARRVLRPFR